MKNEYAWDEIYKLWEHYSYGMTQVNKPVAVKVVDIDYKFSSRELIYGFDWIRQECVEDRIDAFEKTMNVFRGFYSCGFEPLNKGTLHTISMLCAANDDEERAAIWICAFAQDLLNDRVTIENAALLYALKREAWIFLKDRFYMWHHAMRQLTIEFFIEYTTLNEINSIESMINLIAVNSELICNEYVPIFYRSDKNINYVEKNKMRFKYNA